MPQFVKHLSEGWAIFAGSPVVDEENRSWHFYISVEPTVRNLENSLLALNNLIEQDPFFLNNTRLPTIKVLLPESLSNPYYQHDVTLAPHSGLPVSDQDFMGKEISVSMDFDSSRQVYKQTPEEYKQLMLVMWKALEERNVVLNYITPGIDECLVEADKNILTPFCYSAYKRYKKEEGVINGILFEGNANPLNFPNPLRGVKIKEADLKDKKIEGGLAAFVSVKRILTLENRKRNAKAKQKEDFRNLLKNIEKTPNCETVLQEINALLALNEHPSCREKLLDFFSKRKEIIQLLPHQNDACLSPIFSEAEYNLCLQHSNDNAKEKALCQFLIEIKKRCEAELEIIQTYLNPQCEPILANLINRQPYAAQNIFRLQIHYTNTCKRLEREYECLELQSFATQYDIIWNTCKGDDLLTKAKALLADYSKGDGALGMFMRIGTGHVNRSHIAEVQLIVASRDIATIQELLDRVRKLIVKDNGSLATRFAFIYQKYYHAQKEQQPTLAPRP